MSSAPIVLETSSAAETIAVGATLGSWLHAGDVILLHGDLGAGKTTLAKGIAIGLGVHDVVSSPTFGLVHEYAAPRSGTLLHLDLYRLHDEADLESIGFAELTVPTDAMVVVEWPERAAQSLPDRYLLVEFITLGEDRRRLHMRPYPADVTWDTRLAQLNDLILTGSGSQTPDTSAGQSRDTRGTG